MKRMTTIGGVLVLLLTVGWIWAHGNPPVSQINDAPGTLMRKKMVCSQTLLEALLRKDFDRIAEQAHKMKLISEAAEWPRPRDSVYEHYGAAFRRQCSQLESLAQKRNHEGTTFVYLQMTTTCIQCHDYIQDSLRIADHGRADVQLIPSEWPAESMPRSQTLRR